MTRPLPSPDPVATDRAPGPLRLGPCPLSGSKMVGVCMHVTETRTPPLTDGSNSTERAACGRPWLGPAATNRPGTRPAGVARGTTRQRPGLRCCRRQQRRRMCGRFSIAAWPDAARRANGEERKLKGVEILCNFQIKTII
jgi:hypothetical protein